MPYRVLHILSDSSRAGTGMAHIVTSLHRHIPRSDFEISSCFVGNSGPLSEELDRLGIPVQIIPWQHPSRDVLGALRFASFVFASGFDLLHFHWGGPTLRRIGNSIGRAKIVFHLHSSIEENRVDRPSAISTHNSDAVIAVSRAVAKSSSHPRTRVIFPGIEIEGISRAVDRNLCGCALRLTPIKGVSHLLQAIALLKKDFTEIRLEIAGDGPSRSTLQAETLRLGLSQNVRFLGWLDSWREQRARWSVMIQPSLEDGLPVSVIEAMADGIPVVGTNVGGLPEIILDGVTGSLVPPADPRALATAIAKLLQDANLRERFGEASAARVREHFSAQRMADETAALYRELLGD